MSSIKSIDIRLTIDNPPIGQRPHRVGSREREGRARFHCLDCGREDVTVMDRPCLGSSDTRGTP
jgi:hypothetical protein